ncbi:MAG TPA: ABC transporter permease [Bryobacteraceae bacterium]
MRSAFFLRFSLSALRYRRQRLLLAFGALAVAAALATVLFGIYASVEQRIREEFRAYGANLMAAPMNGGTVPLALADAAKREGAEARPVLVTSAQVDGRAVAVAGVTAAYSYWHVLQGNAEIAPGKCLAGESLGLAVGAAVLNCHVTGVVTTGGPEDGELIVDFGTAASLAGIHDAASAIEIQAPGERLDAIRAKLAAQFPAADIQPVRAVAGTESNVVVKMRAVLALLTLLILAITTLCVTSNFSEMVIDRAKEIGIMKALGGAERRIAAFFLSESVTLAVGATAIGYVTGVFAAAGIGREIFGGAFHVALDWRVLAGVGAVMLAVATAATAMATTRIWNIQPAVILRGE